jgi:hypothetical protein
LQLQNKGKERPTNWEGKGVRSKTEATKPGQYRLVAETKIAINYKTKRQGLKERRVQGRVATETRTENDIQPRRLRQTAICKLKKKTSAGTTYGLERTMYHGLRNETRDNIRPRATRQIAAVTTKRQQERRTAWRCSEGFTISAANKTRGIQPGGDNVRSQLPGQGQRTI